MEVIRADWMGMCFGVRRALAVADRIECPETVTIYGDLVHNAAVLARLRSRGFRMWSEADRSKLPPTPNVLVTAHGVSDARRRAFEAAGKRLIDTTCPLVRRVHRAARAFAAEGRYVLVIGRPGHVEVAGIVEDLADYEVVPCAAEVRCYPCRRLGIVCQTTTPPRVAQEIRLAIHFRNLRADVRFADTVCGPTRDRQRAAERLLPRVDAMVVVGGRNSNNTRELVALCRQHGARTVHVQSARDVKPHWFEGCQTVGLTAGTSTLDCTIREVYVTLCRMGTGAAGSAVRQGREEHPARTEGGHQPWA